MPPCAAKIRPFPDSTEIACENHRFDLNVHEGTARDMAYPGSDTKITWLDTDRRNFTGDWLECPSEGCILPAGHRGNHVL